MTPSAGSAAAELDPSSWLLLAGADGSRVGLDIGAAVVAEQVEPDSFQGWCHSGAPGRIFGGQVAAQATYAAGRTVDGATLHSVHAFFLRPGDPGEPVRYEVVSSRDSRAFSTRFVTATQSNRTLLQLCASFHRPEPGPSLVPLAPRVAGPSEMVSADAGGFELRVVSSTDRVLRVWLRAKTQLSDDPLVHAAALAYASDLTMTGAVQYARGLQPFGPWPAMTASLDHTLHLHGPIRMDEWVLHEHHAALAAAGRGLTHGRIFSAGGVLLASTQQEMLVRPVGATDAPSVPSETRS